jgi:DNA (cytosine-5)-methyltransferase 1
VSREFAIIERLITARYRLLFDPAILALTIGINNNHNETAEAYLGGYVMTIISLFSGAGGLDLGLIKSGNSVIWANDIDVNAVETYSKNIGSHITCADIKELHLSDLPSADVVVGGFPCQGFSLANLQRHTNDERNKLYTYFYKVIKEKQPKFFIAENVKGILSIDSGNVIKAIIEKFSEAGYHTVYQLFNMADFGVPQTRQRVFIVGQRKDLGPFIHFQFPQKTHDPSGIPKKWISIREAIGHFPDPECTNNIPNHICSSYKVEYRNFTGHRQTDPEKPSPTILARGNGKGGVCAIPHYNGTRRLTIRESATVQTFPENFVFTGTMNSCYRQIGNAVPVKFAYLLGEELIRLEKDGI